MWVKRMLLANFSSFKNTGWIEFGSGINLIVGQNNAGKSALLRAFDEHLKDDRHRDTNNYLRDRLSTPIVDFDIVASGREIEEAMLTRKGQWNWPTESNNVSGEKEKFSSYLTKDAHVLELHRAIGQAFRSRSFPLHGQFKGNYSRGAVLTINEGTIAFGTITASNSDQLIEVIPKLWLASVFSFGAQRYSVGKFPFKREDRLKPDAANLPAILSKLQGEQGTLFNRLVDHLREVFPTVQGLSVAPLQQEFEIRVWPTNEQIRAELGFGLDDCGTGVAQVIAILTVVMTFEHAVIVIDEISSFLHPAAAKALLRIIQTTYPQHQYIISTHSPEVLSASNPATVHVIRRHGYESTVKPVDLNDLDQLRDVASHLGVSMTDVFAAERIIWVEGQTEELCLPFIYKETVGPLPRGLIVTAVIATGDFNAKGTRRELVFQIYQKLSQATSPLVKSVIFSFDRETLTESQMSDLLGKACGRLLFLPRRHFECFLIHPAAIAAFANNHVTDRGTLVATNDVLTYLQQVGGEVKFKAQSKWDGDIYDEAWLTEVDAAMLIRDACYYLTGNRLEFTKTRHSLELLQHILKHDRAHLNGLIEYIKELFKLAEGSQDK